MKFDDYTDITTDELGYKFIKSNVMISDTQGYCLMCGKPSHYIEVNAEAYFCSDECEDAFYWMAG